MNRHDPHHGHGGSYVRDPRTGRLHAYDSDEAQALLAPSDTSLQPESTDRPGEDAAKFAASDPAAPRSRRDKRRRKE